MHYNAIFAQKYALRYLFFKYHILYDTPGITATIYIASFHCSMKRRQQSKRAARAVRHLFEAVYCDVSDFDDISESSGDEFQ